MDKNQTEHYNMWLVVEEAVEQNTIVWTGNGPFTASFNLFKGEVDLFENLMQASEQGSTGITLDKKAAKLDCAAKTDWLAGRMRSYAGEAGNNTVYKMADTSQSKLVNMRDGIMLTFCEKLHDEATDLLTDLTPYGVTQGILDALDDANQAYRTLIGKPRVAIEGKSDAFVEMDEKLRVISDLLKLRLDNDAKFFELSHPAFYGLYVGARQIVDLPTNTRALDIHVEDSLTHAPIEKADLKILPSNTQRRTSPLGDARVQNLLPGNHNLEVSIPGYQPQVVPFVVVGGLTTKLTVMLVKL